MRIEVDQSGKIEQTQRSTVLAFSNGISGSVLISAGVKRSLIRYLRSRGRLGEWFYPRIYTACLYLLLEPYLKDIRHINLDDEYTGHRGTALFLLGRFSNGVISESLVDFVFVGKKSPAHKLAISIFRKREKPGRKLTEEEILSLIRKKVGI